MAVNIIKKIALRARRYADMKKKVINEETIMEVIAEFDQDILDRVERELKKMKIKVID